jgi:hypothetical protein
VVTEVLEAASDPLRLDVVGEKGSAAKLGGQWPVGVLLAGDLLAAVIAVPLALVLLNVASPASSNSLTHFWVNVGADASFPAAIVLALALAGFYRLNRRAPYESSFSELEELAVALCAGCVISIAFSLIPPSYYSLPSSLWPSLLGVEQSFMPPVEACIPEC